MDQNLSFKNCGEDELKQWVDRAVQGKIEPKMSLAVLREVETRVAGSMKDFAAMKETQITAASLYKSYGCTQEQCASAKQEAALAVMNQDLQYFCHDKNLGPSLKAFDDFSKLAKEIHLTPGQAIDEINQRYGKHYDEGELNYAHSIKQGKQTEARQNLADIRNDHTAGLNHAVSAAPPPQP